MSGGEDKIRAQVSKRKFFRDPVHGNIILEPRYLEEVLRVIDTPEVQRLRRISHLGASPYTYHGAEHSRFGHAMGAMWIMSQILNKLAKDENDIGDALERDALLAALLHDVGHGPFSHLFEEITKGLETPYSHEDVGQDLVSNSPLKDRLDNPRAVTSLLTGIVPPEYRFISELLDGPMDVDKMDYLLRDSHYTGVEYGQYDYQRLLHSTCLYSKGKGRHIGVLDKGWDVLESFILARNHMFWSVYFHKTTRGVEQLMGSMLTRVRDLLDARKDVPLDSPLGPALFGQRVEPEEFLALDDSLVIQHFKRWRRSDDKTLADLADRYFERRLFKMLDVTNYEGKLTVPAVQKKLDQELGNLGLNVDYYMRIDRPYDVPYRAPYFPREGEEVPATVVTIHDDGSAELEEISDKSVLIGAIEGWEREKVRLYSTEKGIERVKEVLGA